MTKTTKALFAAGIVSLLAFAVPNSANADGRSRQRDWNRTSARAESFRMSELQRDRAELRRDQAELERDRAELQRLYRSGASQREINRKRQEIRDGLREVAQDHREISESLEALTRRQDRGFGRESISSSRDRWGRYDNNGWGWGRDRRDDYGGWGLGDLFGWGWGRD
jgi:septal ring factor EnvC (AmiA/AmiB activator)